MAQFRNLTARDIMVRKVFVLRPQMEACQAIRTMLKHKIAGAPVVDTEGHYLGMFSEKHSLSLLLDIEYESIPTSEIGNFMDRKARVVYEDTDVLSIVDIFLNEPYRRLPVLRSLCLPCCGPQRLLVRSCRILWQRQQSSARR